MIKIDADKFNKAISNVANENLAKELREAVIMGPPILHKIFNEYDRLTKDDDGEDIIIDEDEQLNYAVGYYWDSSDKGISCYAFHSEVHFGALQDAKDFLEYVKERNPTRDWKIFKLVEL